MLARRFGRKHKRAADRACCCAVASRQRGSPGAEGGGGAIAFAADRRKPPRMDRLAGLGSPAASSDTARLAGEAWPAVFSPASQQENQCPWLCEPDDDVVWLFDA